MAHDPKLVAALDYILNDAGEAEIDVILKAAERRRADIARLGGLGGFSPASLAHQTNQAIQSQLGMSMDAIRNTVKDYIVGMIRKEYPEITDADLAALLDAFVPEPGKPKKKRSAPPSAPIPGTAAAAAGAGEPAGTPGAGGNGFVDALGNRHDVGRQGAERTAGRGDVPAGTGESPGAPAIDTGGIPPDALLYMVRMFMEYSSGAMPPSKQAELWDQIPGWYDKYWASFPEEIRALVTACLKGQIEPDVFWKAVLSALGL